METDMPKHLVLVLSEPTAGQENEFNDWYENTHIDEVLVTAGLSSGQRFELTAEQGHKCPHRHLAVYEVEAENGDQALKKLNDTRKERKPSDAINRKTAGMWVFAETGPIHKI